MEQIVKFAIFGNFLLILLMQSIVPAQNTLCYVCEGSNSKTCEQKVEKCPNGSCVTISEKNRVDGKTFYSIRKRCGMNMPCGYIYGHADSEVYVYSYLDCCVGDLCNSGGFNLPGDIDPMAKGKGILCPVCYNYGSMDGCNATRSTVCWREDDLCIKFTGTILRPDGVIYNMSAQGCSCKLACTYDYTELAGLKLLYYKDYACYTQNNSAPQNGDYPPF